MRRNVACRDGDRGGMGPGYQGTVVFDMQFCCKSVLAMALRKRPVERVLLAACLTPHGGLYNLPSRVRSVHELVFLT